VACPIGLILGSAITLSSAACQTYIDNSIGRGESDGAAECQRSAFPCHIDFIGRILLLITFGTFHEGEYRTCCSTHLKAALLFASSSSCFLLGFFPGATCRWCHTM
jgi:hypothetical protein